MIASMLQVFGAVDFWNPLIDFFTLSVPIYYFVLFIIGVLVVLFLLAVSGSYGTNILDDEYGRRLAMLCEEARTTEYLRRKLEEWKNKDRYVAYSFDNYLKQLENQGYLKYFNGEWEVTDKVLDYIEKYHGD